MQHLTQHAATECCKGAATQQHLALPYCSSYPCVGCSCSYDRGGGTVQGLVSVKRRDGCSTKYNTLQQTVAIGTGTVTTPGLDLLQQLPLYLMWL